MSMVRYCWRRWWIRSALEGPATGKPPGSMSGRPTGRDRMDWEHENHGRVIKNIYVYPLAHDARQRPLGGPHPVNKLRSGTYEAGRRGRRGRRAEPWHEA